VGVVNRETGEISAKLVYYGSAGAGTSANLECIHRKLKKEHRGELHKTNAPGDESATFEVLPVQLGSVRGFKTSIHLYTVPTGDAHAEQRRHVLRGADGVVFIADARPARYAATVAAALELETFLKAEGRSFADIHLLVQYNHCDEASENDIENVHKSLRLRPAASFPSSTGDGKGVLPALTTISKLILASMRKATEAAPAPAAPAPEPPAPVNYELTARVEPKNEVTTPTVTPVITPVMVAPGKGMSVAGVGNPRAVGNLVELPIQLVHEATNELVEITVSIRVG
jgi:hypothetical protein